MAAELISSGSPWRNNKSKLSLPKPYIQKIIKAFEDLENGDDERTIVITVKEDYKFTALDYFYWLYKIKVNSDKFPPSKRKMDSIIKYFSKKGYHCRFWFTANGYVNYGLGNFGITLVPIKENE